MTGPAAYRMVASGPSALLLEVADAAAALSLAEHLREEVDATDVVPGACTVLVDGAEPSAVAGAVERWDPTADQVPASATEPAGTRGRGDSRRGTDHSSGTPER